MERWDIYDINKHKTGRTMARNDWTMQPGDYHLTVLGIVTNKAGQFLITRRKMDKEWAPGAFEVNGLPALLKCPAAACRPAKLLWKP